MRDLWSVLSGLAALVVSWLAAVEGGEPCHELVRLDQERTQAFTAGDLQRLAEVYGPGAELAATDLAVLRSYDERGLRLRGMTLLLVECRVLGESNGQIRLEVVDRLGPTYAVDASGRATSLPTDRPTRRTVTLEQSEGQWRIIASH